MTETDNQPIRVLFICNDNAARSIMAEALLNHLGRGRFQGFSAGSSADPKDKPHPLALAALADAGMPTAGMRSRSWSDYGALDAMHMDLVVTLCDEAAGETCPIWPGRPATAQWSYPDPRSIGNGDDPTAFVNTLHAIRRHIDLLVNLAPERVSRLVIEAEARQLAAQH